MKTPFWVSACLLSLCGVLLTCTVSEADYTTLAKVVVDESEGLPKKSTIEVNLMDGDLFEGTLAEGRDTISFPQHLEVKYSSTLDGYQALIISTDNSSQSASPRYTGSGSGSGLVLDSNTELNAALHWVVSDSPVEGGYQFVPGTNPDVEPINPALQFFTADKKEAPFSAGYASFIFDIDGYASKLADAPNDNRSTADGTISVYLGANLKGLPAGTYETSTLTVELVTVNPDQTFVVHHRRRFRVQAIKRA